MLFDSDNIFMVDRAFAVLRVFAAAARDFIHRRTLTDVFPVLLKYVRRLQVRVLRYEAIACNRRRREFFMRLSTRTYNEDEDEEKVAWHVAVLTANSRIMPAQCSKT